MMESLKLLQNGFASLDIIRGGAAAADVPERRKKCEKLRKHWEEIWSHFNANHCSSQSQVVSDFHQSWIFLSGSLDQPKTTSCLGFRIRMPKMGDINLRFPKQSMAGEKKRRSDLTMVQSKAVAVAVFSAPGQCTRL